MRRGGTGPLQWIEAFGFSILFHAALVYVLLDVVSGFSLAPDDRNPLPEVQISSIILDPEILARVTEGDAEGISGEGTPEAAPTPGRDEVERVVPVPVTPEDGVQVEPEPEPEQPVEAEIPPAPPPEVIEAVRPSEPAAAPAPAETLSPGVTDRAEALQPLAETLAGAAPEALEPAAVSVPPPAAAVPATPIRPRNPDDGLLPLTGAVSPASSGAEVLSSTPAAVASVVAAPAPATAATAAPVTVTSGATAADVPSVGQAEPVAGAVTIRPAAPSEVAALAPGPTRPVPSDPPSSSSPDPAAAPAPSSGAAGGEPLTPQQQALRLLVSRIRAQLAEPCLVAYPRLDAAGEPELVMMAANEAAIRDFAATVLAGFEPRPGERPVLVDPRQCEALTFVRASAGYPAFRLAIGLEQVVIESGTELDGRIANGAGLYLSALLIDDNGVVQHLGDYLRFTSGAAQFRVPLTRAGLPRDTSQILLVVGTDHRPETLDALNGALAGDFFEALAAEVGSDVPVALVPFDVR
ncbi:MAG: hypothetical protein JJT81_03710 [Rubellimicrobium sp.]|nr:hypothetical protein [Rubellimicrobium sp.]